MLDHDDHTRIVQKRSCRRTSYSLSFIFLPLLSSFFSFFLSSLLSFFSFTLFLQVFLFSFLNVKCRLKKCGSKAAATVKVCHFFPNKLTLTQKPFDNLLLLFWQLFASRSLWGKISRSLTAIVPSVS